MRKLHLPNLLSPNRGRFPDGEIRQKTGVFVRQPVTSGLGDGERKRQEEGGGG